MGLEELVRQGLLDEALALAKSSVKASPADPAARVALFQFFCVTGEWQAARDQLGVLSGISPEHATFAATFGPVLDSEEFRGAVFRGEKSPLILGEPAVWISCLVEACRLCGHGEYEAAAGLRDQAFEEAPATPVTVDGVDAGWVADADPRIGPVLELIMDGVYRWVPWASISSLAVESPKDLRDLVWVPARLAWTNGGEANALIPVRYPGSEASLNPAIRLSRLTEWEEMPGRYFLGTGQRQLAFPECEKALLEVRRITTASQVATHG